MFITTLMFILSKFCHSYNFGQIWSQNLMFSKLTEIWCRGTLLYAYYDFNVYFFKHFVIHTILGKFGPKTWCFPSWLESSICVHYQYFMLIIVENSNFSKLMELHQISMLNFSKYGDFGMKFAPKIWTANFLKNYTSKL